MATRRAVTQLLRRNGMSWCPDTRALLVEGASSRVFGSTSTLSNSAAAAAPAQVPVDASEEVDTVGWGSTTVGTLLRAKAKESGAWLWCSQDDWVLDAIRKMTHANVGSLLVFDPSKVEVGGNEDASKAEDAVVGIFTERDYLTKIVVKGRNSSNTKVSDVMTPSKSLITVTPRHSVLDVMELMVEKNFRHVPVVEAGHMSGMVSIKDVVQVMLKEHREEVGRLNEYIQGTF